jgi:hypothetical protein
MSLSVQTHPNRSLAETARRICESRGGKWSGTKGMACCPAHDDRTPSLGVSLGRQAILFHCFAGCDQQSVLSALAREGFEAPALFSGSATTNEPESTSTRKPSAAALRIWRDAQPLRASPAYALTGIPVWATLGNERFGLVSVPESVTELHLFVDHDAGGELAASRGLAAYARDGRTIHVRKPSSRDTDWNDELTAWLRRKAAR